MRRPRTSCGHVVARPPGAARGSKQSASPAAVGIVPSTITSGASAKTVDARASARQVVVEARELLEREGVALARRREPVLGPHALAPARRARHAARLGRDRAPAALQRRAAEVGLGAAAQPAACTDRRPTRAGTCPSSPAPARDAAVEPAVEDQPGADARRHREVDEVPRAAPRPEAPLGERRGVRVVLEVRPARRAPSRASRGAAPRPSPARFGGRSTVPLSGSKGPGTETPTAREIVGREARLGEQRADVRRPCARRRPRGSPEGSVGAGARARGRAVRTGRARTRSSCRPRSMPEECRPRDGAPPAEYGAATWGKFDAYDGGLSSRACGRADTAARTRSSRARARGAARTRRDHAQRHRRPAARLHRGHRLGLHLLARPVRLARRAARRSTTRTSASRASSAGATGRWRPPLVAEDQREAFIAAMKALGDVKFTDWEVMILDVAEGFDTAHVEIRLEGYRAGGRSRRSPPCMVQDWTRAGRRASRLARQARPHLDHRGLRGQVARRARHTGRGKPWSRVRRSWWSTTSRSSASSDVSSSRAAGA